MSVDAESVFLRRIVDRNETALKEAVDEYGPLMNPIASRLTGNSDFAADVTHRLATPSSLLSLVCEGGRNPPWPRWNSQPVGSCG